MKIFVNSYFSDLNHFFWYLGVFAQNVPFIKKKSILRDNFLETNLDLSRHPQQVFWIYISFFKYLCSIFVFICVIWEFRELYAKFWNFWISIHREIICQSWRLLTLFYSGPIVHCMHLIDSFLERLMPISV